MSRLREAIQVQCSDRLKNAISSDLFRIGIRNEADADEAELLVYGAIGDSWFDENAVTAAAVAEFLGDNQDRNVRVRINSPGGLVFDGLTIHNALLSHNGNVRVTIEGVAASAATIVAAAGDTVEMYENASYMIHRAWGFAVGNTDDMTETATLLNKLDLQIARTLGARAGKSTEYIADLMRGNVDGTWMTADEAVSEGLVDSVLKLDRDKKKKNSVPTDHKAAAAAVTVARDQEIAAKRAAADRLLLSRNSDERIADIAKGLTTR